MTHDHDAENSKSASSWSNLGSVERLEQIVESRVGKKLAHRFLLQRVLAIGGMAAVYEATQAPLMRKVAIKILHPMEVEAGRSDLFLLEANAASNLRHPNIISIVDFGQEPDGTLFLAMEYVPGLDLGEVIQQQFPLPADRIVRIGEQVCLALEVAHNAGVVHCDMKPSNVMIEAVQGNPDFVKVVDFGISRSITEDAEPTQADAEVLGSYAFMAPEQLLNQPIGPHTDVYGLGAVLYATLTATPPFQRTGDDAQLIRDIINTPPQLPSLRRPDLHIAPALSNVVLKALSKNPKDRFPSAGDMRSALLESLKAPTTEEIDENALEILFPETSDFPDLKALDRSFDDVDDDVAWDFSLQAEPASIPSDFPDFQTLALAEDSDEEIIELGAPVQSSFSISGLGSFTGVTSTGDAPLIGREHALEQVWQAIQRTRRGALILALTGEFGSGRSFFLQRTCALIRDETNSIVLRADLSPLDSEQPYSSLRRVLSACLAFFEDQDSEPLALSIGPRSPAPPPSSSTHGAVLGIKVPDPPSDFSPPPLASVSASSERLALLELDLGEMETLVLETLLLRGQNPTEPEDKPFENTPLRFPEVRQSLLRYAFQALLRRLLTMDSEMTEIPGERNPMVLVVDGWDHCDSSSATILRETVQENRSLPILLILSQDQNPDLHTLDDFPEDSPINFQPGTSSIPWSDLHILLPPLSPTETQQLLSYTTGVEAPADFTNRVHKITRGNPLFARTLLAYLAQEGQTTPDNPYTMPESLKWPQSIDDLLMRNVGSLSDPERELLIHLSLLGQTFSKNLLSTLLPTHISDPSLLSTLVKKRLIEPSPHHVQALQFRIPQLRSLLRSFTPQHQVQDIYAHFAHILDHSEQPLFVQGEEYELLRATCALHSETPFHAVDLLFSSAHNALARWEPEHALRRTRQIQLWVTRQLAQHQANEDVLVLGSQTSSSSLHVPLLDVSTLQRYSVQATTLLFHTARLLYHPPTPHTLIPDRLPHHFLEHITTIPPKILSPAILSLAALEVGKFLAVRSLPQSARAALQTAMVYAREGTPDSLLVDIGLHLARNLHQLGHTGRVADLCNDILQRLRNLPEDSQIPSALLPKLHISQPLDLLARLHIGRRQYPRAEHYLDQARASAEADQKHDLLHDIYLHYGHLYHAQNQLKRTLRVLQMALESARINQNLRAQARTLYNLGITCARVHQRTEAHHYFKHSYQISLSLGWADFLALIDDQLRKLH